MVVNDWDADGRQSQVNAVEGKAAAVDILGHVRWRALAHKGRKAGVARESDRVTSLVAAIGVAVPHVKNLPAVDDDRANKLPGCFAIPIISQDRKVRTYNGEDEMTKKTKNASPL